MVGGVGVSTVMGGASSFLLLREFRLDMGAEGGGDLMRGENWPVAGVAGSEVGMVREVRGSFAVTASVTAPGCSCGTLVAESARWMAAAEGIPCADGRLGLAS